MVWATVMESMSNLFQISPTSGVPIYRQIMDQVARLIAGGQLRVDDELPSVRNLARQLEINPMTISKAYKQLEERGLLYRQRGKGMYVAQSEAPEPPRAEQLSLLRPMAMAIISQARQLELPKDQVMDLMHQLWTDRGPGL